MPTHGSLSKAGKVRSQTPKIAATPKTAPSPKTRSRRNYEKRVVLERKPGKTGCKTHFLQIYLFKFKQNFSFISIA